MAKVRNDHFLFHRVAAHKTRGRHGKAKGRIGCRSIAMPQLAHRRSALELARVPGLKNHQTAAAHAAAVALDTVYYKLCKVHVADEASTLVNLQQRLAVRARAGLNHATGKRDCIRARARQRLGQAKSAVDQLSASQITLALLLGSKVVNRHLRPRGWQRRYGWAERSPPGGRRSSPPERCAAWRLRRRSLERPPRGRSLSRERCGRGRCGRAIPAAE